MNTLQVVNRQHKLPDNPRKVYIGRGSPLGNLFDITELWDRNHVMGLYRKWLDRKIADKDPTVLAELNRIGRLLLDGTNEPVLLECFCSPAACHGDYIKSVLEDAINRSRNA